MDAEVQQRFIAVPGCDQLNDRVTRLKPTLRAMGEIS
jgi:hypothetical protein